MQLHSVAVPDMRKYTTAERTVLVECHLRYGSCDAARMALQQKFPLAPHPTNATILRLVRKFRNKGNINDIVRARYRPSVLTEEKIVEIYGHIIENPQISVRKIAQQVDVSRSTAHKALRQHLQLRPYKKTVVHRLLPVDKEARMLFSEWLLDVVEHNAEFLDLCFFSDEAWFHLDGYVNSQNDRTWSETNPHMVHEQPLHPQKVGVWAAMSGTRIFFVFFDTTITAAVYCEMIDQFVMSLTEEEIFRAWFQQDNASAHTAHSTMQKLEEYFGDRTISRGLWPARSPDLSPPDFFLWGYLKAKVFWNGPKTIAELQGNIRDAINAMTPITLAAVSRNILTRAEKCIQADGGHFQHV